jgi:hypothetical protein
MRVRRPLASERLRQTYAREWAKAIVYVFAPCLREEEQLDAFNEVYERLINGLASYDAARDSGERLRKRED